ncbi:hypothetical protein Tco_0975267 [Tanacetum coccineum]|uniref:Xylulose kinase-1 n=1 Tax=Tanacetum coccineum TaxID=301880 RepID=A0ABQ5EDX3_9ASTR
MGFCDKHNMVAFLQKPSGSEEFHQIVDFLANSHIRYALTANPTIYVSLIEQFWQTATVKTVNDGEQQITIIVDGHKFVITEACVRRHLQLAYVDGLISLSNTETFEQLSLMGVKDQQSLLSPNTHPLLLHHLHHNPLHLNQHPHKQHPHKHHRLMNLLLNLSLPLHLHIHKKHKFYKQHLPCPHDSLLPGGYTPGSVEGSMKLKELKDLCTKLVARVTNLETELKKTKEVHGKALTKLVKRVKRLKDKLKSTNERKKAKMVISNEEEELVSEDSSKQGRMEETEYADVEEENAGVEYDFDLTEQQVTPSKAPQVEVQSQETFEAELSVLSTAKILTETSKERVKTYNRRKRSTNNSQVSTAAGLFSTGEDIQDTDEELAKKFDQERKAADDIDWSKIVEQAQERQSGSMIRYHSFKKKPVTVAQARKNMMVYLKNMANYKMKYFKEKSIEEPKELSEEDLKKMLEIVPVEEFRVEALQTKYPIIDWEIHTEGSRKYWKIIRVGNITEAYQGFEDMLKAFDREDLDTLWSLVKEKFRSVEPTEDMERALWVELKRLYEPDKEDTLGHCIYMLPEKDYPLTTAVMMLMLSRRLQVEEDSEMARDLVKKFFIEANRSRS